MAAYLGVVRKHAPSKRLCCKRPPERPTLFLESLLERAGSRDSTEGISMDQTRASQALRSRRECVCVCVCGCLTWTRTRHRHGATLSGSVGDSRVRRFDAVAMAVCMVTRCGTRAHEQGSIHGRVVGEAHGSRPTWFRVGPRHFWDRKTEGTNPGTHTDHLG